MGKSKDTNDEEALAEEPYISERDRVIDRAPAWIIGFCAFAMIASHHGIANCGALFYPGLIDTMNLPISVIAWSISGQFGVSYLFAPLYNRILDYVATRQATILAILLTVSGLIVAACSQNFIVYLIGYTIMAGAGMGIAMVRVIATMAEYFDYYRILALALCSSGSGFGTLIYSLLGRYFIEQYTWRVALIGFAVVHLHTIALCLLLRPIKEDPITEPVVIDPNDSNQRKISDSVTPFTSRISMLSMHTGIYGSQYRFEGSRAHINPQDLGVVIQYAKLSGEKFDLTEGLEPFWNITLDPMNFITDPGLHLTEQLKTIARNYWTDNEHAQPEQSESVRTLLVPLVFLIPATDSDLEPQTVQDLMFDKLHSNPAFVTGSALQFGPSDPKPKSCLMVSDSLSASIMNAYDRNKSNAVVRQTVRKALLKVKQVNYDLETKGSQVHPNPILIILDQDDYFMRSKLTNYGTDERLCVVGYTIPEEMTILEENEDQPDAQLNEEPVNGFETVRSIPKSTVSSSKYARPVRVSSGMGASNPLLIKALAKQYVDHTLYSSRSMGLAPKLGSMIHRSRDLPIRSSRLSMLTVDKPEEAVQMLLSKMKAEEFEETEPAELTKWYSNLPYLNPFFATFLISRTLVYMADSIVFSHLMNFALAIGFSEQNATTLFGYIGISAMIARLGTGFLGQFAEKIRIQTICAPSTLALGVLTIVLPFIPSYGTLAAYGILYSALVAPSFAFANAMVIEIMGTERLDRNLSYVLLMEAFGSMIGAPLGGIFKEIRESFIDCFAFGGVCILISGTIILVHALLKMDCVQNKLENFNTCSPFKSQKQNEMDSVLSGISHELSCHWHSKSSGIENTTGV